MKQILYTSLFHHKFFMWKNKQVSWEKKVQSTVQLHNVIINYLLFIGLVPRDAERYKLY